MANLVKIKLELDAAQLKAEGKEVDAIAIKGGASFESFAGKITAFSFAFNQVSQIAGKVAQTLAVPLDKFRAMETSMANVAALGVPNIGKLTDEVLKMGEQISVPLASLSGGLFEVVSAGVDASHQIEVLEISARAAKAGVAETSEALRLGSSVIKGYGLSWDKTESIMDKAFKTNELGQTTFAELAGSIGNVVPLFAALDINVNELFGSMATLTGVTGGTAEVSTQLKAIATGLAAPTAELTELIFEQTGATVEQAVKTEGLTGILEILRDATGGSAARMTELFGSVEAVNALLALTGSQYDIFREKTDKMTKSAGAMNTAFETQNTTIDSQIQILENRWEVAMVRAVEIAVPVINTILDIAEALSDSRDETEKFAAELEDLNKRFAQTDDLDELLERYDELKKKTNLSATEHSELKTIIEQLSGLYPTAIIRIDEYGQAVEISAGKVKLLVDQQRALLRAQQADVVKGARENLLEQLDLIINREEKLAKVQSESPLFGGGRAGGAPRTIRDIADAVADFQEKLAANSDELDNNLILLSNFFEFDDTAALAKSLGLNAEQVGLLTERWEELTKVKAEASGAGGGAGGEADPAQAAQGIIAPEVQAIDLIQPLREADTQHFIHQQELKKVSAVNSSEAAFARIAELDALERQMQVEGVEFTIGQFAVLMNAAQGQQKELFEIGKVAAIAETTINTFDSATAAYKSMAGIPVVGPALAVAAAAAAVAAGLVNVQRIASVNFEKKREGGFLGDEIRTITAGNFGGGENRLIIANSGEFIVNAAQTRGNRAILEAINAGANVAPLRFQDGGGLSRAAGNSGLVSFKREFDRFRDDVVEAIGNTQVVLRGVLDGQEFLRDNFDDFQNIEAERTI